MLTPEYGKDKILMFRKLGEKSAAAKLALQTEHKWEFTRKGDSTPTKDGAINSDGGLETKLTIDAVSTRDPLNEMLRDSVVDGFKLEVWEIDLAGTKDETGKYPAKYAIGSLNKWEVPENVEDLTTLSSEMAIDGKPQDGYATLTAEQEQQIMYAFKDVTAIV
ncbi:phage major tail protein, TP901-1 family [Streptococcus uberis]|uniref:phage major tail protein, TP901-1 family n=1 Tax=Streptococcus uberis TaxID=1349 RepID=UPI00214FFDC3|nr:phage major tail protein, TP901-1 family [Streptococcus uberis]MCR4258744.1 phage major tail protein, TP901-1 family [Streptococcus uberis]